MTFEQQLIAALKKTAVKNELKSLIKSLINSDSQFKQAVRGAPSRRSTIVPRTVQVTRTTGYNIEQTNKKLMLIINLEYFFSLMAQEYKTAAEEITEFAKKRDKRDTIKFFGKIILTVSASSLIMGLNGCTFGLSGVLAASMGMPMLGNLSMLLSKDDEDQVIEDNKTLIGSSVIGLEGVRMVTQNLSHFMSTGDRLTTFNRSDWLGEDEVVDPYDFFLHGQALLKRLQQKIFSDSDNFSHQRKLTDAWKIARKELSSLKLIRERDLNNLMEKRADSGPTAVFWKKIEDSMGPYMRRFVWRNYCRNLWGKRTGRYVVRVNKKEISKVSIVAGKVPSEDWPNKVWSRERRMWPRHFERICADFIDKNESGGPTGHHISRMIVQCCQVRQNLSFGKSKALLDLSVIEQDDTMPLKNKSEKAKYLLTTPRSKMPATGDGSKYKYLFQEALSKGGGTIGIVELRAGSRRSYTSRFKTRGTRGIWYEPMPPAIISKGDKLTIIIRSTVLTKNAAELLVCIFKHNTGRNRTRTVALDHFRKSCWKEIEESGAGTGRFEVDTNQHAEMYKKHNVNFMTSKAQHINLNLTKEGEYCIILHHKKLQKTSLARSKELSKWKAKSVSNEKWYLTVR
jgi:hypothetical protein